MQNRDISDMQNIWTQNREIAQNLPLFWILRRSFQRDRMESGGQGHIRKCSAFEKYVKTRQVNINRF